MTADEHRRISVPFMFGLLVLPVVFVWFLFLPGYAASTRNAALVYAFAIPVLTFGIGLLIALAGWLAT